VSFLSDDNDDDDDGEIVVVYAEVKEKQHGIFP